jgi:hypothetical protein
MGNGPFGDEPFDVETSLFNLIVAFHIGLRLEAADYPYLLLIVSESSNMLLFPWTWNLL